MTGKVVNISYEKYDVYIGRISMYGNSKWGNPFKVGIDGTRAEVIKKYEEWLKTQPQLLKDLHELRGKVLGCHCNPRACHGDILVKLANVDDNKLLDW